ncbi:MAG TPA: 30S ribosomal protein S20 [Desulfovibrio sp.]|uniref:30S ribosomal protein S20 n=1 Tax=Desulfovibrio TaxID=872 RepID=UPI0003F7ED77|nr:MULTISPECIES: 30S ribosomal protein S20 [Desulfovibrio]MDY0306455.1 30S ribosomal protein S20 [Desulfovibrionaceae bacterium]HMM37732.1 30S ribosomal protein S20 [Desulfovibrio sp.]
MANHESALKRHRQSLKRRDRNRSVKTRIKNVVKKVHDALDSKDKEQAQAALNLASSTLDKAASKKVIHARNAARRIARLQQALNKLA